MHKNIGYHVLNIGLSIGLSLSAAGLAMAQQANTNTPTQKNLYCSGVITDKPVSDKLYVISGEDSSYKLIFSSGDTIYINAGGEQGVRIGDLFEVVRPVTDQMAETPWFKYQKMLTKAMGTQYADIGRLRVVHVDAKTSTAEIALGCELVQRGDTILPFAARPAPQFRDVKLDPYAPPSGKKIAMVVTAKDYNALSATGNIVFVNLGSDQGVKIGDYFRVFRYQGSRNESMYQEKDTAFKLFGFGSAPAAYEWNSLPREIVGEGIVLRTGPNASTVLLTDTRRGIYSGDYVEVE
ncbi:MAG TPA: hypothetical protein VK709_12900 [Candidatus Saccharimonadales bacterium]|jgi:hypothetical protein|nr:hypothetical protein [Candidatus Saccharimonadales bacterium]